MRKHTVSIASKQGQTPLPDRLLLQASKEAIISHWGTHISPNAWAETINTDFHALWGFAQRNNGIVEVLRFFSGCCLCGLDRGILLLHPWLPSFSRVFCFLGILWLLHTHSPAQFFVSLIHLSPVFSFDTLRQRLTEGVSVVIHQVDPISLFLCGRH